MEEAHLLRKYDVDTATFLEIYKKVIDLGDKKKTEFIRSMAQTDLFNKITKYFDKLSVAQDRKAFCNFSVVIQVTMNICWHTLEHCCNVANEKKFSLLLSAMKRSIGAADEKKSVNRRMLFNFVELEELYKKKAKRTKETFKEIKRVTDKSPYNFRSINLMPISQEVNHDNFNIISPVLIKGPYNNVEHYLDSQFRLLREDYVHTVRTGLKTYREMLAKNELLPKYRYESIRVYSGVRFEKCKYSEIGNIAYIVNFDLANRITTKYETSRHFMHGSLLLFSRNEFQTFFCASIFHRNIELLNNGKLYITVDQNGDFKEDFVFDVTFTMIESDVFWEPYSLVLRVLKSYSEESFPMRQHLVEVSPNVEPPPYLYKFREWDIFGYKTNALNLDTWPEAKEIGLDVHQYNALKTALTKTFCVIQGPPGTGKTFLGLKIVEILLKNMDAYEFFVQNPILVICFTNHALDQFLEGILEFNTRLIRVGGQSRSERLNKYNFKEKKALRKAFPKNETSNLGNLDDMERKVSEAEQRKVRHKIGKGRREASSLLFRMDKLNENLEVLRQPKGILSFDCLEQVVEKKSKEFLNSDYALIMWLLDEKEADFSSNIEENDFACIEKMKYTIILDQDAWKNEIYGELFENRDEHSDEEEIEEKKEEDMTYGISLDGLGAVCLHYKKELDKITDKNSIEFTSSKRHLTNLVHRYLILEKNLDKTLVDEMLYETTSRRDLLTLPLDHRWNTYFHWVEAKKKAIKAKINQLKDEYRKGVAEVEKYQQEEDASILETACVVGMTTTGGARYHSVLQKLKPSVVIVEEAAEVLEAHIVASLNEYTEHVILIGDHKQLKPSVGTYELSKNYNLDCSLFERMINNGMYCPVLKVQHRMRPEISSLISPSIYKKLQNHESVQKYESIKGVSKNVFFINHANPESDVEDSTSYINVHEAEFVLELCIYLVNQGYDPTAITMLTTYAAQMHHIKEARTEKIAKVRTCVVDEYQGEENDIIILSLVRSNREGNIGFLKNENRVCVALSRAKKGFYLIGNMTVLSRGSALWQKIEEKLVQNNGIGEKLSLKCKKHGTRTDVATAQDFSAVKGGGCNIKCGDILPCTHVCTHFCHITDPTHADEFACKLMRTRTLECGHTATILCSLNLYLCKEKVEFKSTTCKHTLTRECFNPDTSHIVCENLCKKKLACGHVCPRLCHLEDDHTQYQCQEVCGRKNKTCKKKHICRRMCHEKCGDCSELESYNLSCGHATTSPCGTDVSKIKCPEICGKVCFDCKKPCQKQCWENCRPCMNEVKKMIWDCGHIVKVPCSVAPVQEVCDKLRTVYKDAACGHDIIYGVPCGISKHDFAREDYLLNCEEPCCATLSCGHTCKGLCGQCMQGRLHVGCKQVCGVDLICGHRCVYACEDVCPPCCDYALLGCSHAKSRRRCGAYTNFTCPKRCLSKCKHQACTKPCGDFCNRRPCYEPCLLKLMCGHPCVGFCGEPCPPICRWCNEAENIPDHARYIMLEDCGCVLESHAFEDYLNRFESNVEMYRCPNCDKLIVSTQRFMNRIKSKYQQIVAVNKKVHGLDPQLTNMRARVTEKLKEFHQFDDKGFLAIEKMKIHFSHVLCDKHDIINKQDMAAIDYFTELFNIIGRRLSSASAELTKRDEFQKGVKLLSDVLNRVELKVLLKNKPMLNGLRSELIRFQRSFDFCVLLQETSTKKLNKDGRLKQITEEIRALLYKPEVFGVKKDRQLDRLFQEWKTESNIERHDDPTFNELKYKDFLSQVSIYNWLVCRNKHFYHSVDESAKCPEC